MEWLLVISLIVNGWQFHNSGEMEQSNRQLKQAVTDQSELIGECYARTESMEDVIIKTEASIRELARENAEGVIQLEKLRNRSPNVDDYLKREIPRDLIELLNSTSSGSKD